MNLKKIGFYTFWLLLKNGLLSQMAPFPIAGHISTHFPQAIPSNVELEFGQKRKPHPPNTLQPNLRRTLELLSFWQLGHCLNL